MSFNIGGGGRVGEEGSAELSQLLGIHDTIRIGVSRHVTLLVCDELLVVDSLDEVPEP